MCPPPPFNLGFEVYAPQGRRGNETYTAFVQSFMPTQARHPREYVS